jgi:L-idonate 5-dehydrogenase
VAVKWLEKGIIDPRPILSGNYAYHDIEAALKAASDKTEHSKVLVQFS